jgi:enamine deaminase RidA (YjgF/YER057c/UK114 family)
MTEGVPPTGSIAEDKVASAVVQISLAVEQMSELLEAANGLHQQLVKLLAVLTETLVDLEASLREAREETPNQSD